MRLRTAAAALGAATLGLTSLAHAEPVSRSPADGPVVAPSCRDLAAKRLREGNFRCDRLAVGARDCRARARADHAKALGACPVERKAGEGQKDFLGPEPPRDPKPPPPPPPPPPK